MLPLRRGRKSRSFGVVIAMILALSTLMPQTSVAAASDEPDLPQAGQDVIATPGSVADGQKLFGLNCTYCHGARGVGGRGKPLQCRDDLTAATIYQTVTEGRELGGLVHAVLESFDHRARPLEARRLHPFASGFTELQVNRCVVIARAEKATRSLLSAKSRTTTYVNLGEKSMTWKAPKIVEVPVGMEINMYACAARK